VVVGFVDVAVSVVVIAVVVLVVVVVGVVVAAATTRFVVLFICRSSFSGICRR